MDLDALRCEIDQIDGELLALFLRRMKVVEQVALYKLEQGLPVFQPERERAILDIRASQAPEDMAPHVRNFFQSLIENSKSLQKSLLEQSR